MDTAANIEVYQTMAEILVTVRRIVHRGLIKVSGPTWYEDGCPPSVFDRLVERKENEVAIDRFDSENHELISYASLDDLAEIVEYNEELAKLLEAISPDGPTMVERFREIEALRLKLAAAAPIDDDDAEALFKFHNDFRDAFARRQKNPPGQAAPDPLPPPPEQPAVPSDADAAKDAAPDEIEDEEAGEDAAPDEVGDEEAAKGAAPDEVRDEEAEIDEPTGEDEGAFEDFGTVVTEEDTTSVDLADVGIAMGDGDDVEVLRVVRGEVMIVAEGVLQNDLQRNYVVWEAVNFAGWFDRKKTELEIEPLEDFYTAVDSIREIHRTGGGLEAIKAHLQVVEFSKLLLALREMFLKHGL